MSFLLCLKAWARSTMCFPICAEVLLIVLAQNLGEEGHQGFHFRT